MNLDVQTLLVVMMINMIALSIAIPGIMGWRVSMAARLAQGALLAQTVGWVCLVVSANFVGHWLDRVLATLAMVGLGTGMALLWQSMHGWLGARRGGRLVWGIALAMPVVYGLGFQSYPFRVGWANGGLALQMAVVCVALVWRAPESSPRWRWIMAASLAATAVATGWRGVLGAFFTDVYPSLRTPHPVNVVAALVSNLTVVLNAVGLLVAWREEVERVLHGLARTDSLTGLLNRRALQQGGEALIAQARRHGDALTLLMIDLDHFKRINDQHGHGGGDRALCVLASLLQAALRQGDLAARWGGEEFCVMLARSGPEAGTAFDQRLRAALERRAPAALGFQLAFSTGMSSLAPDDKDLASLLQRADAALYQAKASGRGRLCIAERMDPASLQANLPSSVGATSDDSAQPTRPAALA